jgi:hypothetical protein
MSNSNKTLGDSYGRRGVAQISARARDSLVFAVSPCDTSALHGALRASPSGDKTREIEREGGRKRERDAHGPGSMFHRAREIMARPAVGTRLYLIG